MPYRVRYAKIINLAQSNQPAINPTVKMSIITNFEPVVFVNDQMSRLVENAAKDMAIRAIMSCATQYGFNGEEAVRALGLEMVRATRKASASKEKKVREPKTKKPKSAFPLPFNGEICDSNCYALKQDHGLYTQCSAIRKNGASYCKKCQIQADKNTSGKPDYGTIQDRLAVGLYEFKDPKGKSPTPYAKIMKKYKITEDDVKTEAGKFNIVINDEHFQVSAEEGKRGRPKAEPKPKAEKGAKGRPKKAKKVVEIDGDDDDLFSTLVAQANAESATSTPKSSKSPKIVDEEEEAEKAKKLAAKLAEKEAEKAKKLAEKEAEKLAKEAAKEAEKAKKLAEKEAEKLAKEAAKEAEKAKKLAEKEAKEAEKAKKLAEKEAKKSPKSSPKAKKNEEEDDDEPKEVWKKIKENGKAYLHALTSGIIYDYEAYKTSEEQVVVGKWDDATKSIKFNKNDSDSEEEVEEYDE